MLSGPEVDKAGEEMGVKQGQKFTGMCWLVEGVIGMTHLSREGLEGGRSEPNTYLRRNVPERRKSTCRGLRQGCAWHS